MDVKDYIQLQFAGARRTVDAVMGGTTDEQFNWAPPGMANSMRTTFVHMLGTEDGLLHGMLLGQPTVWDAQGWSEKVGLAALPIGGHGWDEVKNATLALAPVLDYQQAVRAATDAYLATVTAEELDRKITFMGSERSVAEVLAMLGNHTASHAGDMAAIKGIQGVKGLPF
jgi:hypothetical protein